MDCVDNCEFMDFTEGNFSCKYYEEGLKSEKSLDIDNDRVIIHRCNKCIEEEIIGSNTVLEMVRKIKQNVGWMADSFYSFKDEFESTLTDLYRIIKEMEYEEIDKKMKENE